jgi:hypothetical protein
MNAILGFVAAALSVLIFHQGAWGLLHLGGLMPPPYPMTPVPPWGVPQLIDFCFWGGLYGAGYGLLAPKLTMPFWLSGLALGAIATLVFWFVVLPIKGAPVAGGWGWQSMLVVLAIQLPWGIGVGLIWSLFRSR